MEVILNRHQYLTLYSVERSDDFVVYELGTIRKEEVVTRLNYILNICLGRHFEN
jgi:hypothetical protein